MLQHVLGLRQFFLLSVLYYPCLWEASPALGISQSYRVHLEERCDPFRIMNGSQASSYGQVHHRTYGTSFDNVRDVLISTRIVYSFVLLPRSMTSLGPGGYIGVRPVGRAPASSLLGPKHTGLSRYLMNLCVAFVNSTRHHVDEWLDRRPASTSGTLSPGHEIRRL